MTTVVYHSADFDGLFCREIARKFLPNAELIGWDFGDKPINRLRYPLNGHQFYILDLPVDRVFGFDFGKEPEPTGDGAGWENFVWIDHHKTSIETHPTDIPGYRIDGVAACRLAWQWFYLHVERGTPLSCLPSKEEFVERELIEPLAVRLAGEYDVFDKRDPRAELFQHGLRSQELSDALWDLLLVVEQHTNEGKDDVGSVAVDALLDNGRCIQYARDQEYKEVITQQGFDIEFEGVNFLACCSHECDIRSQLFEAGIKPHHEGLLGFTWTGADWRVSLYGVPGKPGFDLSEIAKKYGGGGHRQACGMRMSELPFLATPKS